MDDEEETPPPAVIGLISLNELISSGGWRVQDVPSIMYSSGNLEEKMLCNYVSDYSVATRVGIIDVCSAKRDKKSHRAFIQFIMIGTEILANERRKTTAQR